MKTLLKFAKAASQGALSFVLALALTLLSLTLPASAQAAFDQPARDYAWSLYAVYQQAMYSGNWNAFSQSCAADPLMTKKAFISTLLYVAENVNTSPTDAQSGLLFANSLAQTLNGMGDPAPAAIMQAAISGQSQERLTQMVTAYAAQLYPALASQPDSGASPQGEIDPATFKYGDSKERVSQFPSAAWALLKPIYLKAARIDLAISFANPELSIQELDGFSQVASEARSKAISMGGSDTPQTRAMFEELLGLVDAPKLVILAELGLASDFDARLESTLSKEKEPNKQAGVLLSGVNQALQRGDQSRAKQLLSRIRPILATSKHVPPALEYGIRTAEYRASLGPSAAQASSAQVGKAFEQAWAAIKDFRPFVIVANDEFWYFARRATRYWLSQLSVLPGGDKEAARVMQPTLDSWLQAPPGSEPANSTLTPDDIILHSNEITAKVGVGLAILDQSLALYETFSDPSDPASLTELENLVTQFSTLPNVLGWDQVSPGFPPYRLDKGGLCAELLARIKYLRAKNSSLGPEQAAVTLGEALKLVKTSGFPQTSLEMMLEGGRLYQKLGRSDLATAEWKQALSLADSLSYTTSSAEAASLLAEEFGRSKNWSESAIYADKATSKLEESVALVNDQASARKLSQTSQQVTEVSVVAAVESNNPQKALAALIKGKEAEAAAAQMSGQKEAHGEVVAVEQQKQEVAALTEKVHQLEAMPASDTRNSLLKQAQELLAKTKTEFLVKARELRQKYPELYSRVLKFDPLDLPDVQKALPPEAAVIQYFPTEDALYIFLVTREDFRLRKVAITEKELDQKVTSFVRAIRRINAGDAGLSKESQALFAALIEPCQEDIANKGILVFIPTGRLNILPFACLTGPSGSPLIESKLVLEMAKPTDFLRIAQNPPKKVQTLVAFANATGDLPAASKEGDQIAAMFPNAKLFKEGQATKKNFFEFGSKAEVLHLATHGESNSENALTNYLKLSGNERVAQEEIFALTLDNTSIVTLSACNTATGDNLDSKFVASLAEAFWLGGSQSVVASLWAVNDDSTGLLMTEFYRELRAGKGKAQALKEAQLKVRATPGYEHPYFWAGFLLFGDWR